MFDEKQKPTAPQQAQDMFGDAEPAVPASGSASVPTPQPPLAPPPPAPRMAAPSAGTSVEAQLTAAHYAAMPDGLGPHASRFGILKVALIAVLVLALVAGSAYAAYRMMTTQSVDDGGIVESVSDDGVITDANEEAETTTDPEDDASEEEEETEDPGTLLDSDGDGLTNAEELEAGTHANRADSDADGLGDREEVKVYDTDPNEADTDDDGFLDGQEVKNGYNPNGDGKLFVVPAGG